MSLLKRLIRSLPTLGLVFSIGVAVGDAYPDKALRIITSEPGGSTDFVSRLVASALTDTWGQRVIVDNRSAGIGVLGQVVAKAPADGYTLFLPGNSLWIAALLQKVPYDPITDFAPIAITHSQAFILVAYPSLPARSVKELIDLAKTNSGSLNYGSTSIGSTGHIAGELLKSMAHINIVHIPYKGTGGLATAVITDEVQLAFASTASTMPHIKAGRLRALAVTSVQPSALAPGLPTVAATLPGFEATPKAGMFVPAKTPPAIIAQLNRTVVQFLNRGDIKDKFLNAGLEVEGSSSEEFAAWIKSEMVRVGKVIREAGIRTE